MEILGIIATIVGGLSSIIAGIIALFKESISKKKYEYHKNRDLDQQVHSIVEEYNAKCEEARAKENEISELRKKILKLEEEKRQAIEKKKEQNEIKWQSKKILGRVFLTNRQLTYKMAERDAAVLSTQIMKDDYYPTIIVAIGRGGAIFGSMLSYKLYQVPIFCVDRTYTWQNERKDGILFDFDIPPRFLDKVLLVSGEVHSSNTMKLYTQYLQSIGAREVRTCTFYLQSVATSTIDYNITKGSDVPFMPWQSKNDYLRDSISMENYNSLEEKRSNMSSTYTKTIYVLRHGETAQNASDIFIGSGTDDAELTEQGRSQASTAVQIIRNNVGDRPVSIHCSPQARCLETARLVSESFNVAASPCGDLKERCYGVWENQSRSSLVEREEYKQYLKNPLKSCPEGAETMQSTISRAVNFLKREIFCDDGGENHIVVTHKTTGRVLLAFLMNIPYSQFRNIVLDNSTIVKVTIKGKTIDCQYLR